MSGESDGGEHDAEWSAWWNARLGAMEQLYGPADSDVGHAIIPFELGAELGGGADVVYFRQYIPGVVYVTSELIGRDDQIPNTLGNYELAICHREDDSWGPNLISRLAYFTREAKLEPTETIGDEGESLGPAGSKITALLLAEFGRFVVHGRDAGVLLLIGITADELAACHRGQRQQVEEALRAAGVWPYTDLNRSSVLPPKPGLFGSLFKRR